ncbi:AzlD domain-containing protein [Spirochaeta isovalerica]|uniref:Branched-subunit amino acid transport protein n=1 Tax=Spirochaeta isovalerica TaxID=150 RepID=A0A841RCN4_9SPIO|nr:AzlD domain-containing protein [Spirochaeta isovalerica]MBB6480997.1 branched-subunit amino acid transport protein [Spirochaeta isovalerica]
MTAMQELFMILGMMAVTFSVRYVLLAFSGRFTLPESLERALRYVPPAVLTAIIIPSVLLPDGQWDISMGNAYLPAAVAATIAGFLFPKKVLAASIISGLVVFALFSWLLPIAS